MRFGRRSDNYTEEQMQADHEESLAMFYAQSEHEPVETGEEEVDDEA